MAVCGVVGRRNVVAVTVFDLCATKFAVDCDLCKGQLRTVSHAHDWRTRIGGIQPCIAAVPRLVNVR